MGKASHRKQTAKKLPTKTEVALPSTPERQASLSESNALWGSVGLVASLIITVVAGMIEDLRWLLWVAWLASWLTIWVITQRISQPRCESAYFVLGIMITGLPLYGVNALLEPKTGTFGPQLSIESDKKFLTVPQNNQPAPPKVSRFARIKVAYIGGKSVANVKATVTRINDQEDWLLQLPLSLKDTLLKLPTVSMAVSANLNSGDSQYFDAVVECNGEMGCPKGQLAIPSVAGEHRGVTTVSKIGSYSGPEEFTVRASGDGVSAVTKTFVILRESSGHLFLEPKSGD